MPTKAKKTAVKKTTNKVPAKKAVKKVSGVIGSMVEFLSAASAAKPLSKAELLEKLVARFKDREADGMKSTINAQLPTRIAKEQGVTIRKDESGYWISK
jgi:hypothetical protein